MATTLEAPRVAERPVQPPAEQTGAEPSPRALSLLDRIRRWYMIFGSVLALSNALEAAGPQEQRRLIDNWAARLDRLVDP